MKPYLCIRSSVVEIDSRMRVVNIVKDKSASPEIAILDEASLVIDGKTIRVKVMSCGRHSIESASVNGLYYVEPELHSLHNRFGPMPEAMHVAPSTLAKPLIYLSGIVSELWRTQVELAIPGLVVRVEFKRPGEVRYDIQPSD